MTDSWRHALPQASVRGSCRGYRYLSCPRCRHRLAATPTIAEQTDFEEAARAPPFRFCLALGSDLREKSNLRWRLMHGFEHRRMLAHAKVIVGTPDGHPILQAMIKRVRKVTGAP